MMLLNTLVLHRMRAAAPVWCMGCYVACYNCNLAQFWYLLFLYLCKQTVWVLIPYITLLAFQCSTQSSVLAHFWYTSRTDYHKSLQERKGKYGFLLQLYGWEQQRLDILLQWQQMVCTQEWLNFHCIRRSSGFLKHSIGWRLAIYRQ